MLSNNKTGSLSSLVPQRDVSNPLWTCPSPTLTITSLFMQHKMHDNLQSSLSNFKPLFHEHSCYSPTQLDLKFLHQNTATSSDPFATQTTNELPDSAREKKRDEKNY
jgi:hypothetical protein